MGKAWFFAESKEMGWYMFMKSSVSLRKKSCFLVNREVFTNNFVKYQNYVRQKRRPSKSYWRVRVNEKPSEKKEKLKTYQIHLNV